MTHRASMNFPENGPWRRALNSPNSARVTMNVMNVEHASMAELNRIAFRLKRLAAIQQQRQKEECVRNRNMPGRTWNPDGKSRTNRDGQKEQGCERSVQPF